MEEVIAATNPTVEGEATAVYLSKLLKPLGIKVSRIGMGVPVGNGLELADEVAMKSPCGRPWKAAAKSKAVGQTHRRRSESTISPVMSTGRPSRPLTHRVGPAAHWRRLARALYEWPTIRLRRWLNSAIPA